MSKQRTGYGGNKRAVQHQLFKHLRNKRVIGLCGPDPMSYIDMLKQARVKEVVLFEERFSNFVNAVSKVRNEEVHYGNILSHIENNAIYDLDFCASVLSIEDKLPLISKMDKFLLTLSLRPVGLTKTLSILEHYDIHLPYIKYKDTSPMVVFYNL